MSTSFVTVQVRSASCWALPLISSRKSVNSGSFIEKTKVAVSVGV